MRKTKVKESNIKNFIDESEETIEIGINEAAVNLIIDRLTDIYTDKIGSVVRELVSNALDATYNNNGKVYIKLPGTLSPNFIVRDEGVGMSIKDLKEVYTKYGASTKADDMNQIGAYGLGAKVPLAYTNFFTIETIKDKEKIKATVIREANRTSLKINKVEDTNEKNGTTITVPVDKYDYITFAEKCKTYEKHKASLSSEIIIK